MSLGHGVATQRLLNPRTCSRLKIRAFDCFQILYNYQIVFDLTRPVLTKLCSIPARLLAMHSPSDSLLPKGLQALPLEVLTEILRGVNDWKSLKSAIRCCKVFFYAYRQGVGMAAPLLNVVRHEPVVMEVINEHLAAHRSVDYEDVSRLDDSFDIVGLVGPRWTGEDAAILCHKRRLMLQTRDEFFADTASRLEWASGSHNPLSEFEKNRFNSTFLLFMTFYAILQQLNTTQGMGRLPGVCAILDISLPWVNEQMHCLYDYFHDKAASGKQSVTDGEHEDCGLISRV